MIFRLSATQENQLLNQPETGMGYQVVEANKKGNYTREKFLILNSEIAIEMNGSEALYVKRIIDEGIMSIKTKSAIIDLLDMNILSESQFRNVFNEPKIGNERGAIDNPIEYANGEEIFVRLSAFDNDRRVDKVNKRLRPGSYTTSWADYLLCKLSKDDPIERYALPNNETIKFAFHIKPMRSNVLQRGVVQPAYNKSGGGKEVYFVNGTGIGTFIKQTDY